MVGLMTTPNRLQPVDTRSPVLSTSFLTFLGALRTQASKGRYMARPAIPMI